MKRKTLVAIMAALALGLAVSGCYPTYMGNAYVQDNRVAPLFVVYYKAESSEVYPGVFAHAAAWPSVKATLDQYPRRVQTLGYQELGQYAGFGGQRDWLIAMDMAGVLKYDNRDVVIVAHRTYTDRAVFYTLSDFSNLLASGGETFLRTLELRLATYQPEGQVNISQNEASMSFYQDDGDDPFGNRLDREPARQFERQDVVVGVEEELVVGRQNDIDAGVDVWWKEGQRRAPHAPARTAGRQDTRAAVSSAAPAPPAPPVPTPAQVISEAKAKAIYQLWVMGLASVQRGDNVKARECFERIIEMDPNNAQAAEELRKLYNLGTIVGSDGEQLSNDAPPVLQEAQPLPDMNNTSVELAPSVPVAVAVPADLLSLTPGQTADVVDGVTKSVLRFFADMSFWPENPLQLFVAPRTPEYARAWKGPYVNIADQQKVPFTVGAGRTGREVRFEISRECLSMFRTRLRGASGVPMSVAEGQGKCYLVVAVTDEMALDPTGIDRAVSVLRGSATGR